VSKPVHKLLIADEPQQPPDLLEFQRRMAQRGMRVQLPSLKPNWDLPEPIDLGGVSLSEMVVRLRRGEG
jgi:hypothetical protein